MTVSDTLALKGLCLFTVSIEQVFKCTQQAYLCNTDSAGVRFQHSAANEERSSWFLAQYTCVNVHPHPGRLDDNKDLDVGATT